MSRLEARETDAEADDSARPSRFALGGRRRGSGMGPGGGSTAAASARRVRVRRCAGMVGKDKSVLYKDVSVSCERRVSERTLSLRRES